ncbi:MAG: hypothetical protein AB4041_17860 [Microcystaceae cyanobacterium]
MLIKLTPSILNNNSEFLPLALENLALTMREGKHLVVAETRTLKAILNHPTFKELGLNSQRIYLELFNNNDNYGTYLSYVSLYIEVIEPCLSPQKIEPKKQNDKTIIQVPVSFFQDSEMIQKTILLCENQEDTKFYEIIGRVYRTWMKFNIINFAFTPQGGGGSTIASEYESIQSRKSRFCLCIVDSDKLSPNSSEGKTAKGLLDKHDANSVTTELYLLKVREAENLIPYEILLQLLSRDKNKNSQYQTLSGIQAIENSEIRLYVDIKEGTRLQTLFQSNDQNFKSFWQNQLTPINNIGNSISLSCLRNWQCQNTANCNCEVMPSFGKNILSETLKEFDPSQISIKEILAIIKNDQLLLSEWDNIGQQLINWGITWVRVRV